MTCRKALKAFNVSKIFKNVKNYILANNKTCLDKAIQIMEEELTFKKPIGIKLEVNHVVTFNSEHESIIF